MFNLNRRGPEDEWFTTGMRDLVLGTAPSTTFGSLVAILAPYMRKHIHEVTTAVAALRDVEGRHQEAGGRNVRGVMPRQPTAEKKKTLCRILFR